MRERDEDFNRRVGLLLGAGLAVALGGALMVFMGHRQVKHQQDISITQENLRQIADGAAAYMLRHSVTRASYGDIYATGTDGVLAEPQPVRGEDYGAVVVSQGDSQISVSWRDGTVVTYDH